MLNKLSDMFWKLTCNHGWETIYPTKRDGIDIVEHYFGGGYIELRCVMCGKIKVTRIKP